MGQSSWPRNAPGRDLKGKTGESPKETGTKSMDDGPREDSDARTCAKNRRIREGPRSRINEEVEEVLQTHNSLLTRNKRRIEDVREETTDAARTAARSLVIGLHQSNSPRKGQNNMAWPQGGPREAQWLGHASQAVFKRGRTAQASGRMNDAAGYASNHGEA
ncbi:hypothetical protein BC827DRAFT_1159861 [Russula dissimulans]|nr:hypothetical protein BC827DRAFT_1159861 [Russula dissimulans]